ncbi:MAG TPA: VOC family protein, partial [Dehalococcoidia bacterium]|nr:VOC family protein [Dehalococcoidia bacterium]
DGLRFYRDALGLSVSRIAELPQDGVRVAFLPLGEVLLELLEPLGPDTAVGRFLARRGEGVHHVALATDGISEEMEVLRARQVELVDEQARPGAEGLVCFLHPRAAAGVLVELVQEE